MPTSPPAVVGYTSLTQQTRICLENAADPPGEQLLMPLTAGASTMSLTTQPSAFSPTTGMHLHFFVLGNATAGSIAIVGTNAVGGAQTSITYHVPIAPQNHQGYTEFTTKEAWATVTASSITLTTLTPCTVMVWGSYAGKFLLPISLDKEEKIAHFSPPDKRGILFKNFRVVQLTKGADVSKFDSSLYPDSLWAYYMSIGTTPVVTTVPAVPVSMLAATTVAATMTLTTSLSTVAPGMFLIFTPAANSVAGTIVLAGKDQNGYTVSETITVGANNTVVYSTHRYSSINNAGADKFATTGMSVAGTLAVTAVFAWTYAWTYDGVTNYTPYSGSIEAYDGVEGFVLPGTVLSDMTLDWQKEKEIMLTAKGTAQDLCVVGDPTSTVVGTNPFPTLPQPTSLPYTSWPATFYIESATATPFTSSDQDGSMLTYKFGITTGRKWVFAGDGMQRASFVTWDTEPDFTIDTTIIYQNYQNYVTLFKPNTPLILSTQFQGTLLGSSGSTVYYETVQVILPCKIDTFKIDQAKNPVEGALKIMSQYDPFNLGYAYKVLVTAQQPPTYTA